MANRKIYFIDVIYYNCYKFYKKHEKNGMDELSGQVLLAVLLSLNLGLLIMIFESYLSIVIFYNKWNTLYLYIPILILLLYRYNKSIAITEIEDNLLLLKKSKLNRINLISKMYIIVIFLGTLILALYIGEINNPPPFWESWLEK